MHRGSDYKLLFNLCLQYSDNLFLILSEDLIIQEINAAAATLLGWTPQDVLNKKITHVFKKYHTQPFINLTAVDKPSKAISHILNNDRQLKISWDMIPLFNPQNKCELIFIVGKNTTELTEQQLENLQLANVVKYAPGLFYWKDKNSVYQGCNDEFARLAGLDSWMEVRGKTDFDLAWKDRAQLYIDVDKKVIKTGKAMLNIEENITVSDHRTITAITNKVPLLNHKNQVVGVMGITTDITRQKKVEHDLAIAKEQAEAANHAKTEFIANMSHDIRTPLSGVVGISKLLEEKASNPEEKQYAQWINEGGEQLLSMLNGILEVASVDQVSEMDIHQELFDIRQCIRDVVQVERPTTELKKIALHLEIDEAVPQYLIGDWPKLHRILLNLLGNAIKFTQKGEVILSVQKIAHHHGKVNIRFQVSDTGIGIPDNLQGKVFDRFFRASPSYKGVYAGHGVGLHIARSFVKLMGGEIELISQEGVGTTFSFDLTFTVGRLTENIIPVNHPKTQKPSDQDGRERIRPSNLKAGDTPLLLLVEDNVVAQHIIELIVGKAGCRFVSAADGEDALKKAKSSAFDLIITDIGLPGMSGQDLTRQIREWERQQNKPSIPIVGLTAHSGEKSTRACIESGMNEVLTKPITLPILQNVLRHYVSPAKESTFFQPLDPSSPEQQKVRFDSIDPEVFECDHYPLLDAQQAIEKLGQESLLHGTLSLMLSQVIPHDLTALNEAYADRSWDKVAALVHKIKGGALYCGTIRLNQACQSFERYYSSGQTALLSSLYDQLINVVEDTKSAIEHWIKQSSASRK